jgi:hypothetical protein
VVESVELRIWNARIGRMACWSEDDGLAMVLQGFGVRSCLGGSFGYERYSIMSSCKDCNRGECHHVDISVISNQSAWSSASSFGLRKTGFI